jgi:hypothetical protein
MGWAKAREWNSTQAVEIARNISSIPSLYCGPAAVGWIAAVWNQLNGRPYDYMKRLSDKHLFPDGPRPFHGVIPGFQKSLNNLLRRETQGDLKIASKFYFGCNTIYDALQEHEMPIIMRMMAPKLMEGLHYVTLYKSERQEHENNDDQVQFYWQDNGLYGDGLDTGLSKTSWKKGSRNIFPWGAKRIMRTDQNTTMRVTLEQR